MSLQNLGADALVDVDATRRDATGCDAFDFDLAFGAELLSDRRAPRAPSTQASSQLFHGAFNQVGLREPVGQGESGLGLGLGFRRSLCKKGRAGSMQTKVAVGFIQVNKRPEAL